jgi:hypothetical protein
MSILAEHVLTSKYPLSIVGGMDKMPTLARGNLDPAKGGSARAKSLTPERRQEIARKAVQTRWLKAKMAELPVAEQAEVLPGLPVAKWTGVLAIGDVELPVYVLDDGRRVISRTGATSVLTEGKGGGNLESYIGVGALKNYLPENLPGHMIEFSIPEVVNKTVAGMSADTFLDICRAYVNALNDPHTKLTDRQRDIAVKASMFSVAVAKVGLIALFDEATGYQYARAEDALKVKLRAFLAEELRKWEKTFPDELWIEFGRLTGWQGSVTQRPKYWGKIVMEVIYEYLDPDVAKWLKEHAPKPQHPHYHRWLSEQYGLKKLIEHIWMVIGIARTCRTMTELKDKMAEMYGKVTVQYTLYLPGRAERPE